MRFFAILALVCGASALKLHQAHPALLQVKNAPSMYLKLREEEQCVWAELEAWAHGELKDGGTITKKEAYDAINGYAKKHGVDIPDAVWKELEDIFDAIDTNGDGELCAKEVKAAMDAHAEDWENVTYPTEEEIVAWVEAELAKDGDITKKEAADAIQAWAKSQGVTIPKEVWDVLEAAFDAVDANGDGRLTHDELVAAFGKKK